MAFQPGGFDVAIPKRATLATMIAYCADVGSVPKGGFGWARATQDGGSTLVKGGPRIDDLVSHLADDIEKRHRASLGIEAPLFLPVPGASGDLCRGRDGDSSRSCFASAGACVTTLGMHELTYLLARLKARLPSFNVTLDWRLWSRDAAAPLLLWEAFVSGSAHTTTNDHVQDAATAATRFVQDFAVDGTSLVTVKPPRAVFSLAGAALLWAGLTTNLETLRAPTFVIKPTSPWSGKIERV